MSMNLVRNVADFKTIIRFFCSVCGAICVRLMAKREQRESDILASFPKRKRDKSVILNMRKIGKEAVDYTLSKGDTVNIKR